MRARGLKQALFETDMGCQGSRPMRARGLKQYEWIVKQLDVFVAPHAGAWIETVRMDCQTA